MKRLRSEFVAKYPEVNLDERGGDDIEGQDLADTFAECAKRKQKLLSFEPSLKNGDSSFNLSAWNWAYLN